MSAIATEIQKKRQLFTSEQDNMIKDFVANSIGRKPNWKSIAAKIGKTPRQCRERYRMYLSPNLTNKAWTEEEDELLRRLVEREGKRWASFKSFFPGRSDNCIKNRYNYHIEPIRGQKKRVKPIYHHTQQQQQQNNVVESNITKQIAYVHTTIENKAKEVEENCREIFELLSSELEDSVFCEEDTLNVNEIQF